MSLLSKRLEDDLIPYIFRLTPAYKKNVHRTGTILDKRCSAERAFLDGKVSSFIVSQSYHAPMLNKYGEEPGGYRNAQRNGEKIEYSD